MAWQKCPRYENRLTPKGKMPICNYWSDKKEPICQGCPAVVPTIEEYKRFFRLRPADILVRLVVTILVIIASPYLAVIAGIALFKFIRDKVKTILSRGGESNESKQSGF